MASQNQMAALLKGLLTRGLESAEAIPTIKAMMKDKIFSLDQLTADNMPASIDKKIPSKILKKSRKNIGSPATTSRKKQKTTTPPIVIPPVTPPKTDTILINRSPILTLWATVVAKKVFSITLEEALTFGSAYAAECARTKGSSLGIYSEGSKHYCTTAASSAEEMEGQKFSLMNQTIPANQTVNGLRAIGYGKEQDPHGIWKSLTKKLGENLSFVLEKMEEAADQAGEDLEATAYSYYIRIRPDIPQGTKGWGAHGHLEVSKLSDYYPLDKAIGK